MATQGSVETQEPASSSPLRIAMIGCGKIAQTIHLPALALSETCRLVAVCDSSRAVAEAVGARYQIDGIYSRPGDVLRDPQVDAVIIAVGDPDHVSIAAEALGAQKHCLVEKPLGVTASECESLRPLVEGRSAVLQVGVMKRHDPAIRYAKRALDRIGRITSFSFWYRASADRFVDEASIFLPVIRDPAYSRPAYKRDLESYYLVTHGAHLLDMVGYMLGRPLAIQTVMGAQGANYSWHSLLRLRDGVVGNAELSVYVEGDWSEGFDLFGELGTIRVRTPNPCFLRPSRVKVFDSNVSKTAEPTFASGNPYACQLDAFAASALKQQPLVAGLEDGIAALQLIEASAASAKAGGREVLFDGHDQ